MNEGGIITGINSETETSSKVISNVYPNPAKDLILVKEHSELFDLLGNKVAFGSGEINIHHLLPGIYMVITNGKSQKIIKE